MVPEPEHEAGTAILVCRESDKMAGISQVLVENGIQVQTVPDGASAMRVAKRDRPDYVFAYAELPDSSGLKIVKTLKHRHPLLIGAVFGVG